MGSVTNMSFTIVFFVTNSLLFATSFASSITLDLIHKDSLLPPSGHFNRLNNSLRRSINRVNQMNSQDISNTNSTVRLLPGGHGDYLMKMSIGTPPVDIYASLETTSALVWTECKSCTLCINQTGPHYDPSGSSTYASLPCDSSFCYPQLDSPSTHSAFSSISTTCSNDDHRECFYFQREASLVSDGILATDRVTLGQGDLAVTLPNVTFGCGMFNAYIDDLDDETAVSVSSGTVGLAPGTISLVSSVYRYSLSTTFSYCLSSPLVGNGTSKIRLGVDSSETIEYEERDDVKSTPMWVTGAYSDYRFVLSAISVDGEMVEFLGENQTVLTMIMDTGSPLTYLPVNFFEQVVSKVESSTQIFPRSTDPSGSLRLCYNVTDTDIDVPDITLHLGFNNAVVGGLPSMTTIMLKAANLLIKTAEDVTCLALAPILAADTGVYGSLAQTNFLITYDFLRAILSFEEVDCSKIWR